MSLTQHTTTQVTQHCATQDETHINTTQLTRLIRPSLAKYQLRDNNNKCIIGQPELAGKRDNLRNTVQHYYIFLMLLMLILWQRHPIYQTRIRCADLIALLLTSILA